MGASGEEVQVGVFGGWIDVGVLGGGWTRESGGGRIRGGWIDELVYLVSVVVECVCVKASLVLVLVLGWTQMSPARSRRSASHAAGTHGWLPRKTGWPGLRRGGVGGYNLHSVPPPPLWRTNHEQAVSVWCRSASLIVTLHCLHLKLSTTSDKSPPLVNPLITYCTPFPAYSNSESSGLSMDP